MQYIKRFIEDNPSLCKNPTIQKQLKLINDHDDKHHVNYVKLLDAVRGLPTLSVMSVSGLASSFLMFAQSESKRLSFDSEVQFLKALRLSDDALLLHLQEQGEPALKKEEKPQQ